MNFWFIFFFKSNSIENFWVVLHLSRRCSVLTLLRIYHSYSFLHVQRWFQDWTSVVWGHAQTIKLAGCVAFLYLLFQFNLLFLQNYTFWLPISFVSSEQTAKVIYAPFLERISKLCIWPFQIFISCFISVNEILMIEQQPKHANAQERHSCNQNNTNNLSIWKFERSIRLQYVKEIRANMNAAQDNSLNNKNTNKTNKNNEILIVALANTSSKPWTVVVQTLNAAIADSAVHSSRRSVDVASWAVLYFGQSGIHHV